MVRRAAALLDKAAAAAASGELLPSCACIHRIMRWRNAPLLTLDLQMVAGYSIVLLPAAESLRLLNVGAGKPHARVRSSSRNRIKAFVGTAMEMCMYMSCSTSGSFWPATASCFPGKSCGAHLQAYFCALVVSCGCLLVIVRYVVLSCCTVIVIVINILSIIIINS